VDLHLRCKGKEGVLEVKSYTDQLTFRASIDQAARYARSLRLPWITLALFVPVKDETVIDALSGDYERQGAMVAVSAIAWA
jgi:hypothetical protein